MQNIIISKKFQIRRKKVDNYYAGFKMEKQFSLILYHVPGKIEKRPGGVIRG